MYVIEKEIKSEKVQMKPPPEFEKKNRYGIVESDTFISVPFQRLI